MASSEDIKLIPLPQGEYVIVDASDYDWLSQYKWHLCRGYAVSCVYVKGSGRENQKSINTIMHRLITKAPKGTDVDHINGNRKDNRKSNLRLCTRAQNTWNTRGFKRIYSAYKGVTYNKRNGSWQWQIRHNGKLYHGQSFLTEDEAAVSYNMMCLRLRGEFAKLNLIPAKKPEYSSNINNNFT
jgi:hypothetical protein